MATIRELLGQRTQELTRLLDQIRKETAGDIDLERLTTLSDELGARADDFARTLTSARETLEGDGGGEEEGGGREGAEQGASEQGAGGGEAEA